MSRGICSRGRRRTIYTAAPRQTVYKTHWCWKGRVLSWRLNEDRDSAGSNTDPSSSVAEAGRADASHLNGRRRRGLVGALSGASRDRCKVPVRGRGPPCTRDQEPAAWRGPATGARCRRTSSAPARRPAVSSTGTQQVRMTSHGPLTLTIRCCQFRAVSRPDWASLRP